MLALSLQPVADHLLAPLEAHYPTWQPRSKTVKWIVVLGGGYTWNPDWQPSANLVNNSLPWVTEGIRHWRAHPGATMVFIGAAVPGNPVSSAEAASRVAQSLGVPTSAIVVLDSPRDTRQEATGVAWLVGQATPVAGYFGQSSAAGDGCFYRRGAQAAAGSGESARHQQPPAAVGENAALAAVAEPQRVNVV